MKSKKSLSVLILFIFLSTLLLSACSNQTAAQKLSELNDSDLTQYITNSGITIPEGIGADTIREMVTELENDPEHETPAVGYTLLTDLYEDLRNLVVDYGKSGK